MAPITPWGIEQRGMDPRRTEPRYARQVDVEVAHGGAVHAGFTRDLSLSGLCARLEVELPFGARVKLTFSVPGQPKPVEVEGDVRWTQDSPDGGKFVGIQFLGLRARDVWALNRFFQANPVAGGSAGGR